VLSHANILVIFDFGRVSGAVVAVMELLESWRPAAIPPQNRLF
jgi:hypothetical protein